MDMIIQKDYEGKKGTVRKSPAAGSAFPGNQRFHCLPSAAGIKEGASAPAPEKRTQEYYRKRPCEKIIGTAALILEEYLSEC